MEDKVTPQSPTYSYLLLLYIASMKKGKVQTSFQESADLYAYERAEGKDTFKFFQDITVFEQNILNSIENVGALKLVGRIAAELRMNNALWYYKPKDRRNYESIKALINIAILKRTEDPYIFLVNPMLIRRGTIHAVLAHTITIMYNTPKVNKDMIHDIRYNDRIKFDQIHMMNLNNG